MSTFSAGLLNVTTLTSSGTLETNEAIVTNLSSLNINTSVLDVSGAVIAQNLEMFDASTNPVTLNGTQLNALLGLLNVNMAESVVFPSYVDGTASSNFGGVFTYRVNDVSFNYTCLQGGGTIIENKNLSSSVGYIEAGDSSGRLCLLLHGWPGLPTQFTQLVLRLLDIYPGWHYVAPYYPGIYPSGQDTVNTVVRSVIGPGGPGPFLPIDTSAYPLYAGNLSGYINNPDPAIGALTEYMFKFIQNIRPDAVDPSGNKNMVFVPEDWGSVIADMMTTSHSSNFSTNTRILFVDVPPFFNLALTQANYNWNYNKTSWYYDNNEGIRNTKGLNVPYVLITDISGYIFNMQKLWLDSSLNPVNIQKIESAWNPALTFHPNYINDLNNTWGPGNGNYSFLNGVGWYRTFEGANQDITATSFSANLVGTAKVLSTGESYYSFAAFDNDSGNYSILPATFSFIHGANDGNINTASLVPLYETGLGQSVYWPHFFEQVNVPNAGKNVYLYNPDIVAETLVDLINH